MRTVHDILHRRDRVIGEIQEILAAHPDGTELPEEVQQRADKLEAEARRLKDDARRQSLIDERDRNAPGVALGGAINSGPELRVFRGQSTIAPSDFDGLTLRTQTGEQIPALDSRHRLSSFVSHESMSAKLGWGGYLRVIYNGPRTEDEHRAMAEGSSGAGGVLVPTYLSAELIDALLAQSVAFKAGARLVPMTSQTLKFARVLTYPQGAWRAENSAITEDQPSFDALTLIAKSWALIVRVSRELLEDGTNVDAQLRQIFAKAGALALDKAILYGSGTSNQPLGIANTSGIQTISMGTNGASLGSSGAFFAPVYNAILALEAANAGNVTAMVMAPQTAAYFYGGIDGVGQPLHPSPRIANIPMLVTTSMPINEVQGTASNASSIILGDFNEVFVGMRTELQVSVLQEKFADTGQVGFVLWMRADVALARPAAMARIVGIIP